MKKAFKVFVLSLITLPVGYAAVAVPFRLFSVLGSDKLAAVFFAEVLIYAAVGIICVAYFQKQQDARQKNEMRHRERCRKIREVQTTWYDIAA